MSAPQPRPQPIEALRAGRPLLAKLVTFWERAAAALEAAPSSPARDVALTNARERLAAHQARLDKVDGLIADLDTAGRAVLNHQATQRSDGRLDA